VWPKLAEQLDARALSGLLVWIASTRRMATATAYGVFALAVVLKEVHHDAVCLTALGVGSPRR
jgi:hypothetical protein